MNHVVGNVSMFLRQKSSPFEKVERIAWIIDRWHREQER
jgi:hypothetical protein